MKTQSHSQSRLWGASATPCLSRRALAGLAACWLTVTPLGLASCSSGEDIQAAPTPAAPATATSTPTPTPTSTAPPRPENTYPFDKPVEPPERYEHTQEGAIKTAEYFVDQLGYIVSTNDTLGFADTFTENCEYCAHRLNEASDYSQGDAWVSGFTTTSHDILNIFEPPASVSGEWGVAFRITIPEYEYFLPDEDGYSQESESQINLVIALDWDGDRWNVIAATGEGNGND